MGQTLTASLASVQAYPAARFCAEYGANAGDAPGVLEDLVPGDIYALDGSAPPARLAIDARHDGSFRIAPGSALGTPGAALHLDALLTLQPDDGAGCGMLLLVEADAEGLIAESYLMPLAPLRPDTLYTLIEAARAPARRALAQSASAAFTRGTRITLATGEQRPIEALRPGDRILTRDDGVQPLRWSGQSTLRATGSLAPILIRKGALNNDRDLIVSPAHRLMVYQRRDLLGTGAPEILIRARDLVNGHAVVTLDGGFVDYVQILFDRHHIVYAEGIAAESTFLDPITTPALPEEFLSTHPGPLPAAPASGAHGLDVGRPLLQRQDAVELLKRASLR
ncbi:Hint domain-containing protein [Cribrihabitans pelagius]|uniref:Hint domain-containing protein n=1 Tax=Cribrihabitans pelagius TaxID=1765746 RepID=UPI003B5CFCB6